MNPKANIFGSVEFRNDQADASRDRVYLDEAYLNLYLGSFDIRVGKQIYAWGRADGFNPTDNLTSWDYTDFLDTEDERLGLISARVDYYFGDWILEGILAPTFKPSVFPDADSRWFSEMKTEIPNPQFPAIGQPTIQASYTLAPSVLPEKSLNNTQYAVKLSGIYRGWDFSFSWFDGFDDLPAFHTKTIVDSGFTSAEIILQPRYHRRRAIGADAATAVGSIGLRGEAAYYLTEDWSGTDPAIDDPYLQYALGADRTFSDVLPGKDLFVLLQWVQEVQIPDRQTVYRITDLNHVFRKSVMGKADLSFGEYTKLTFEGIFNVETEDWWVQLGFDKSIVDGLNLFAIVDLLGGPQDSFFGPFIDNHRAQVKLKYSF
ncbi:MAG: hypothetical protein GWN61_05650 [candidate division Zixibacteria bacterium]|nr:hypothetical protein [candidate division Zixibacteria bacterium]NIU13641.1 hypothetical protein [candidate division Zixibacteria bacterium]NIV05676.1 hypothetical protein [candidate division Zixibacteria bacterium]NIW42892.1 hypothetical protein [candidate division Zixibacteria bacterium]